VIKQTNEAIAHFELQSALKRQAERDIVIQQMSDVQEQMRVVINALVEGQIAHTEDIVALRAAHSNHCRTIEVLQRQSREFRERQDIIAAVCDAFAEKLSATSKTTSALVQHVTDVTEP
jgi:hypothetical protein